MNLEDTKIILYPHQVESIKNMEAFEQTKTRVVNNKIIRSKIGINSDITGYGKTISIIGLIIRDRMSWNMKTDYSEKTTNLYASGNILEVLSSKRKRLSQTLILVGSSMLHQWKEEFKKTNLRVYDVNTEMKVKDLIIKNYDVILVIPTFIKQLDFRFHGNIWKRFVFDEPSNIILPTGVEIKAGFTWFVTATPNLIWNFQNRRKNIFMRNFCKDIFFFVDHISVKNDEEFTRASFAMPKTNFFTHICYDKIYKVINDLIDEKTQQLIEMGNINEAVIRLGGKSTSNIIDVVRNFHSSEYEKIISKLRYWESQDNDKKEEKIKKWEEKEAEMIKKMNNLEIRIKTILNGKCCICFENLNKPIMDPHCKNIFCGTCLFDWLKNQKNCPLCRAGIEVKDLVYIKRENEKDIEDEEEEKDDGRKSKKEQIFELISKSKDFEGRVTGKFIIYSDESLSFNEIRNFLQQNKIQYVEMKGNSNVRNSAIYKFKEDKDCNVAFLNSIKDCSGINFQETTDIIFYHEINENIRIQVIGRANRIGRKQELNVHELLLEK